MKVLVLGATGATGHEVVQRALGRGHVVAAFVRNPDKFGIRHVNLSVMVGDVTEYTSVEHAVSGQDAVVSALGSGNSLKSHSSLTTGIQNTVRAMEHTGVRRVIYLSMLGVDGSRRQLRFVDRCFILPLLLHNVVADHTREERLIKQSRLDWVTVRPPRLTNGPNTGSFRTGEDIKAGSLVASISRADVAYFMVKQLTDDRYVRCTPAVLH